MNKNYLITPFNKLTKAMLMYILTLFASSKEHQKDLKESKRLLLEKQYPNIEEMEMIRPKPRL